MAAPITHGQNFCPVGNRAIHKPDRLYGANCPFCEVPLPAKNRYLLVTVDDDGTVVSSELAPKPPIWKRTPVILGVVLGVVFVMFLSGNPFDDTGPSSGGSGSCGGFVGYSVDGTARSVDITMNNKQGNTEQLDDVPLPWHGYVGELDCGAFVYVSAQNQGETGTVTCEIVVGSAVLETATSSGSYVIASCSGRVE